MTRRDPWTWVGLAVVGVTALVWSFTALSDLARRCGVTAVIDLFGWTDVHVAWGLPITVDVLALVATRVWLRGDAPAPAIEYARRAAWAAIVATIVGNGYHGWIGGSLKFDALIVSAVPAVVIGVIVHLAVLVGRPPKKEPLDEESTREEVTAAEEAAGVPVLAATLARAWLYRLIDSEGNLLYVGVTQNLTTRLAGHRRTKPWWPDVANVETEVHATRAEALAAEMKAIASEGPRYNVSRGALSDSALVADQRARAAWAASIEKTPPPPDRSDHVDTSSLAKICDDLRAIAGETGRQYSQDEVKAMYGIGAEKAGRVRRQLGWWPRAVEQSDQSKALTR